MLWRNCLLAQCGVLLAGCVPPSNVCFELLLQLALHCGTVTVPHAPVLVVLLSELNPLGGMLALQWSNTICLHP